MSDTLGEIKKTLTHTQRDLDNEALDYFDTAVWAVAEVMVVVVVMCLGVCQNGIYLHVYFYKKENWKYSTPSRVVWCASVWAVVSRMSQTVDKLKEENGSFLAMMWPFFFYYFISFACSFVATLTAKNNFGFFDSRNHLSENSLW